MSAMIPMAVYGLEVPAGDIPISARPDIPSAFRITMAAIDPTAVPEGEEGAPQRATLKIIRQPLDLDDYDSEDDDDEDDFDPDEMERILAEEDDEDDEMVNGGPSDPTKSKKARKAAAEEEIKKMLAEDGMDVEDDSDDEVPNGVNGTNGHAKSHKSKAKGKMPASDEDDDDEDEDDESEMEVEEFVICTLDPSKNYNQPLDITVGEDERVWFKVTGTHSIFLTGNYVEPAHASSHMHDHDDDDEDDYDLEPSDSELEDEEDELDDMPRITEVEEEEAPKLVKAANKKPTPAVEAKKASKKRSADDDEPQSLDNLIANQGEVKLSKKQLKKMKKNDGSAAAVEKVDDKTEAPSSAKSDKKVSFAKNLEQGPTPTTTPAKDGAADKDKPKATSGAKVVQGVTIDDKKTGTGPAAKSGDRVGMRYIGKLQKDNKIFDSNKKGKPFTFKLGAGQVIKGWDIGVAGMSVGGERRITIPANLAYGSKGAGPDIPPNATLIFDIKCLEVGKGGK
ncbi:hypothetical protein LTR36_003581 [Oleoguttula mirabilis]|uniref:peptidylprolyl isomerase n=1 Tax=Oleoguttula mirabilis TaxID=1507867 RepID=A0AAV9JI34_9PEZI|nr:hypothetical protein LTR36_003581 [Oleoguttula mirabilis]